MHETKYSLAKGYVDSFDFIQHDKIRVRGWCFHEIQGIRELRIRYQKEEKEVLFLGNDSNRCRREDVSTFYKNPTILACGWEFTIHDSEAKNMELQMYFDSTWNTIFTFEEKEKSGFMRKTVIRSQKYIPSFVVVDDFYENPDEIRELALSQTFSYHPDYHKGKRTDGVFRFDGLKESFESILGCKIKNWEHYGVNGCFQYCIAGDQLVYHHDTQEYAGVLFLTPDAPPQCGTTFYRSKHTKKSKVPSEDHPVVFQKGFLDPTEFDVVDVVGNVYNRVVLFDAQMIHAASTYFGSHLENGRLFQLFFFDLER